jgi:hypothetical protein
MNGDDSVQRIVVAGEQRFVLQAIHQLAQAVDLAAQVAVHIFAFTRQLKVGGNVIAPAHQIRLSGENSLQALLLAHHFLRLLVIGPEIGIGSLLVDFD